jgi:spermidine/putrescine transport system ATP-binding protein
LGGTCEGADGAFGTIRLGDGSAVKAQAALVYGRTAVDVGIRPEKIRLHRDGEPAPEGYNHLEGTVVDTSYLGVSTQYIVETRGGARVMVYEQNIERTTRAELWGRGDTVHLSWSPDHTFVVEAGEPAASDGTE